MTLTLDEQMERFEEIEGKVEEGRRKYNNLEARFDIQKETYREKKEELEGKGYTFKTGAELQKLYKEKGKRLEELLSEMENTLGISDEDDDDEEEFDMFEQ